MKVPHAKKCRERSRGGISRSLLISSAFAIVYFAFDWWVLSRPELVPHLADETRHEMKEGQRMNSSSVMYERLLALAAHALAESESKEEPEDLWKEPFEEAAAWAPCAHKLELNLKNRSTGYIMINANGGLNQQRVAICNGVAVASLLNATLVIPKFLYSSVWRDNSQFGDIYQEDYFINYLKNHQRIVKQLPVDMQSLDLQAIGSVLSDLEVAKEAKPSFYLNNVLPILLRNRVVLFSGFGNRLSFDPIPSDVQRLRCKCNFHALKFVPKIENTGRVLIQRMRREKAYLGLHLRFEIDMVAHSMCEFGGGESERMELKEFRKIHFPMLAKYDENKEEVISAAKLRELGQCPLTPEEAVLMLAALGFRRSTRIFLAGAHIYGGRSRMSALLSLYPNIVTKEDLLSSEEIEMFANHSSQLAALDLMVCAAADVFAMTDSGSQLASLVSGFRMYYGGGKLATIRPNKRRLAGIFQRNKSVQWSELQSKHLSSPQMF